MGFAPLAEPLEANGLDSALLSLRAVVSISRTNPRSYGLEDLLDILASGECLGRCLLRLAGSFGGLGS